VDQLDETTSPLFGDRLTYSLILMPNQAVEADFPTGKNQSAGGHISAAYDRFTLSKSRTV
jgi:hypothetical protein